MSNLQDSVQLPTVLALYEQENIRNNEQPSYSRLKTSVRRHIDQTMRTRNFRDGNEKVERGAVPKSQKKGEWPAWRAKWEHAISGTQLGNAYTALDVSICSPHALEAGTDCTQSRVEAKLEYYGPHLAALLRQNISYTPIVWSAYGRPHPDTLTVLRSLSKSIARKRNIASAEVVFHRLHSSITLEIWRRRARQIRTCWPVDGPPGYLGHGHLAPDGGSFPRPGSLAFVSRVLAPVSSSRALVLVRSPGSGCPGPPVHLSWPPLAACHSGAPGAWPWRSLSHSICCHLCQRSFALFFWCPLPCFLWHHVSR